METIGDRIRKLRDHMDWSQGEVARRLKTTRSQISQLELGLTHAPTTENLVGLASLFGMTVEEFVRGTTAEKRVQSSKPIQSSSQVVVLSNAEAELYDRIAGDQDLARRLIGLIDSLKGVPPTGAPHEPRKKRGH